MATKYEVLEALVEANICAYGDEGNGIVVSGVVSIISQSWGSEEELANEIYDYIADCFTPRQDKEQTSVEG